MKTLKEEVLDVVSKLPDSVQIDDIMYKLYVLEKVRKGKEAVERGEVISVEDLEKEVQSW